MADQFTRWLCDKCDKPGFDSWNKAAHDGIVWQGDIPNPLILGDTCQYCGWLAATCYTTPAAAPTALYADACDDYASEPARMEALAQLPSCGVVLRASMVRDADWSRGCVAARSQLQ